MLAMSSLAARMGECSTSTARGEGLSPCMSCVGNTRHNNARMLFQSRKHRRHRQTSPASPSVQAVWGGRGSSSQQQQQQPTVVVPAPAPEPGAARLGGGGSAPMLAMAALVVVQALALVGATTTGVLARKRRLELENMNTRLRQINSELRKQRQEAEGQRLSAALTCDEADSLPGDGAASSSSALASSSSGSMTGPSAADLEAQRLRISALENALRAPAAAHPSEGYGNGDLSLAAARRRLAECINAAREAADAAPLRAVALLDEAAALGVELGDARAQRAVLRARANTLRKLEDLRGALRCLEGALELSAAIQEHSGDADTLGEIADVYVELGEVERAAEYYDRCLRAIEEERPSSLSSTWDV